MTAKEHYERHLGNFYPWMAGDFTEKQSEQQNFFVSGKILPGSNKVAFDLGAGHGLQSISLANLGFFVTAIDFNAALLRELRRNANTLPVKIVEDDLLHFLKNTNDTAELIVCMGDTLTHLESIDAVAELLRLMKDKLIDGGRIVLSFRDLTSELQNEQRFLPVKSDSNRILMCFLEYFPDRVMVHDILHEKHEGKWIQKVSAYPKLRLNEKMITQLLHKYNLRIVSTKIISRMIHLVAEK